MSSASASPNISLSEVEATVKNSERPTAAQKSEPVSWSM